MNILLVTETYLPFISGVSSSSDSIARFMVSRGHTVTIVSPAPVLSGDVPLLEGLTFVTTPSVRDPIYKGKPMTVFPFGFPGIYRILRQHRFDIVHIQEPGSVGFSALCAAKILHVPTVGALHFTPDQVARMTTGTTNKFVQMFVERYIRAIYRIYDAIMVPTETFSGFLRTLGVTTRIQVVSNGVNTDLYTPPARLRKKKKNEVFQCLYIGRLDKDKNVMTIIEALQYARPSVTLVIAGTGKDKEILVQRAKELHVDTRIVWKGTITESQMIALYKEVDCFILMAEFEVQSIVTLQALASGLPVLGARAGALPELIHDGENGYTLNAHDAQGLGEKMNELLDHPKTCMRMGKESRRISLNHHKPTALARLEALYIDVARAHTK